MFLKLLLHLNICIIAGALVVRLCSLVECQDDEAKNFLTFYGVKFESTAKFEGIRSRTLEGVLWMAAQSDCDIIVTGATEQPKTQGAKDYSNGYKVNIASNDCLDDYITKTFTKLEPDGVVTYPRYRCLNEYIYYKVKSDWVIVS